MDKNNILFNPYTIADDNVWFGTIWENDVWKFICLHLRQAKQVDPQVLGRSPENL